MDTKQIPLELAQAEFDRWAEAMDLDLDPAYMDSEDRTSFERQKRRVINALQRGSLVISEAGEAVYTPQKSQNCEPLTFHERTGASLMAMDGKKKNQEASKTYAVMADICQTHPKTFAAMKGEDIKVCEALFAFLMD